MSGDAIMNIVGERVALGPLRSDCAPLWQQWMNDYAVRRTFGVPEVVTLAQVIGELAHLPALDHHAFFLLHERRGAGGDDLRPIGFTYLSEIDDCNRTAEFGILIGEADARGKGYGTEATRLMLDYAFTVLGLHNVILRVYAPNRAGTRAYEKAGFRECARRRGSQMIGGRFWDTIFMECLSTGFADPTGARSAPLVPPAGYPVFHRGSGEDSVGAL